MPYNITPDELAALTRSRLSPEFIDSEFGKQCLRASIGIGDTYVMKPWAIQWYCDFPATHEYEPGKLPLATHWEVVERPSRRDEPFIAPRCDADHTCDEETTYEIT